MQVAAIISGALQKAGIAATLSGGAVVSIYTDNEYQSKDLDFVTAATVDDLASVLAPLVLFIWVSLECRSFNILLLNGLSSFLQRLYRLGIFMLITRTVQASI